MPGAKRSASVSGVGRPAYVVSRSCELRAERVVGERLAPAALELVERRDQRLGDVAAAVVAEVAHARASSHERPHLLVVLDPGRGLELRRRVHRPRLHGFDRGAHVVRPEPARRARGGRRRARVLPVVGILALPRAGRHARDRLAVAEQDAVAPAHGALLALVELDEVGALLLRLADEDGDAQHACPAPSRTSGARRGEPSAKMKPQQVGSRFDRGVDVLLARQPADLDERPREQLAQLRARVGRAHQRRADEDGVRAGELGRGGLRPRVDARSPRRRRGRAGACATSSSCAARSIRKVPRSRALTPITRAPRRVARPSSSSSCASTSVSRPSSSAARHQLRGGRVVEVAEDEERGVGACLPHARAGAPPSRRSPSRAAAGRLPRAPRAGRRASPRTRRRRGPRRPRAPPRLVGRARCPRPARRG